jgi:hypothetical protein
MIPLNEVVKVYKGGNTDAWGIATHDTNATEFKGMVTYSSKIEEMKTAEGETVVITATIVFKGKVDIQVGDEVSFENSLDPNKRFKVLQVQPVNDLSGKTVFTKAVV